MGEVKRKGEGGGIMAECTCGGCTDEEQADRKHGLSRGEKLRRDPDYGDYLYEQEKDKKMEVEDEKV